jgi:hypothetical protein
MAQLFQRRYLKCPYNRAQDLLAEAVQGAAQTGEERVMRLTLAVPAVPGAEFGKEVIVTVAPARDPMHFDEPWKLHWEPKGDLYPAFDGTLTVRADESYASSMLELEGTYNPPLGAAGAAFDALLGQRIAAETAREFLRRIGTTMEAQYHQVEEAKHNLTKDA